jgi:hypothetical protein
MAEIFTFSAPSAGRKCSMNIDGRMAPIVNRFLCVALLGAFVILSSTVPAAARGPLDDDEEYYEPVESYKMTTVKSVTIKKIEAWPDDDYTEETPEDCAKFKLNKQEVRDFFRRAEQIDYETFSYYLASRCYAMGEIAFANGDRGTWRIDFERRGVLNLSEGRKLYFFCSKCRSKAFYP